MKGSILFVTMTACLVLTVHSGYAQSPGAGSTAGGASGNAGAGAILTAVEVAELWMAGQTDAENFWCFDFHFDICKFFPRVEWCLSYKRCTR